MPGDWLSIRRRESGGGTLTHDSLFRIASSSPPIGGYVVIFCATARQHVLVEPCDAVRWPRLRVTTALVGPI
jgi:hypothetical protein